jgi:hypothetical protein
MLEIDGSTFYWVDYRRRKRSGRNLALYADKESKITGEIDCVHLELRFQSTAACAKAGLTQIYELADLDPAQLLNKHLKFTDFDVQAFLLERLRRAIAKERDDYLRSDRRYNKFIDQYRTTLSKKFKSFLDRVYQGRAQIIHSINPHLRMNTISLGLPKRLEWPIETARKFMPNSANVN